MERKSYENLRVADAMDPKPWSVLPEAKVEDVLSQLVQKQMESCIVVEKNGNVRGGLDIRDLSAAQFDGKKRKTVGELLTQAPLVVSPQTELLPTLEDLKKRKLSLALVVDGKNLMGELRLGGVAARLPTILERSAREIEQLRAESENKDEYLGLVSHDIRAPLTVIALCTDYLLTEDSAKSLTPDQKSFVERIKRNGDLAASMVHDILDVVRLDHGFQLDCQMVRFADLLNESLKNLDVVALKKHVTFQVTHEQDIQVNIDPGRMRQVIENLLINAIKFSPQGGQVFVRTFMAQKESGPHLAFQVRDQGHGIRKEDEARIFEAFVQTGRHNAGPDGVGLGLAIVRKFVEFHQGTIELDGGWQKGASITVFVPHAKLITGVMQSQVTPQGPVILLVEDDESIREFYKQSLEEYKYHVIEASDGAEGYTLFQKHNVDLVLSDIRMPNVDGLELLARIRSTGNMVPVILCSGYYVGLENDLTKSDHKPNRVIDKPFKVKDMVAAIDDQLRRYKQAS